VTQKEDHKNADQKCHERGKYPNPEAGDVQGCLGAKRGGDHQPAKPQLRRGVRGTRGLLQRRLVRQLRLQRREVALVAGAGVRIGVWTTALESLELVARRACASCACKSCSIRWCKAMAVTGRPAAR